MIRMINQLLLAVLLLPQMVSPVQAEMDLFSLMSTRGPGKLQNPDSFLLDKNYTLYFSASDGIHGRELWIGDWSGLYMLKDLNEGPDESAPDNFFTYEGLVFFSTTNSESFGERGLWMTDGSADGTKLVAPLSFSFPMTFVHFGDEVYFAAEDIDMTMGVELYKLKADLSVELVKDIFEGPGGSYPDFFVEFNGKLFFGAGDDVNGRELWMTDGSADGTILVSDINPGVEESSPGPFVEFEGVLYFATTNMDTFAERGLWKTDGTAGGTVLVQSMTFMFPMEFVAVGDSVFFAGSDIDEVEGQELWMFYPAATPSVVGLVKDINPTGSSYPSELTAFNGDVYFAAGDSVNGRELWVSDGSEAGTYMLADINPGSDESSPGPFHEHMGILFFAARSTPDKYDTRSLWMTNGTSEGTEMVASLYIDSDASFISFENGMYFAASRNSSDQFEKLFVLDLYEGNVTDDDWMDVDKPNMTDGENRTGHGKPGQGGGAGQGGDGGQGSDAEQSGGKGGRDGGTDEEDFGCIDGNWTIAESNWTMEDGNYNPLDNETTTISPCSENATRPGQPGKGNGNGGNGQGNGNGNGGNGNGGNGQGNSNGGNGQGNDNGGNGQGNDNGNGGNDEGQGNGGNGQGNANGGNVQENGNGGTGEGNGNGGNGQGNGNGGSGQGNSGQGGNGGNDGGAGHGGGTGHMDDEEDFGCMDGNWTTIEGNWTIDGDSTMDGNITLYNPWDNETIIISPCPENVTRPGRPGKGNGNGGNGQGNGNGNDGSEDDGSEDDGNDQGQGNGGSSQGNGGNSQGNGSGGNGEENGNGGNGQGNGNGGNDQGNGNGGSGQGNGGQGGQGNGGNGQGSGGGRPTRGIDAQLLPEEADCTVLEDRFECLINYENLPFLEKTVTVEFNCLYDEQIGMDVSSASDCECTATWTTDVLDEVGNIFAEQITGRAQQSCQCGTCPAGSSNAIAVDCGISAQSFFSGSCAGLRCDGELSSCSDSTETDEPVATDAPNVNGGTNESETTSGAGRNGFLIFTAVTAIMSALSVML